MRHLAAVFAFLGLSAFAQERLQVHPAPPRPFILTEEGDTGRTAIAVPTATPPGRYTATTSAGGQSWTLDVTPPDPVPASIHPPAVLLNGWQIQTLTGACPVRPSSGSFGRLEELFRAEGRPVLFFDNCRECPGGSIEDCALALKDFLAVQRTQAGDSVPEFDLIGHSMGGLIARAYLAGMTPDGWFPPEDHRIRKLVLIATPNFGAYTIVSVDQQTRQMQEGSQFQWDLATWHQGSDDFRGVDALAIAGAAHNRQGDGVVSTMSASIAFAHGLERTRVLDYCHTSGINLLLFCRFSRTGIAEVDNREHQTWRILNSFLNGRTDWRSIGSSAATDPWLRLNSIGFGHLYAADDQPLARGPVLADPSLILTRSVFPFVGLDGTSRPLSVQTGLSGGVFPLLFKYGPVIGRVLAERRGPGLAVEAGQWIEILGQQLENAEVQANNRPLFAEASEAGRIRAWLPDDTTGLVWLTVRNDKGTHTVRIMATRPAGG